MAFLPLANIMHHKTRSLLCAMGVAVGVCMLITLTGLSRGSLYEISDRMASVDADAIVVPAGLADKTPVMSGLAISQKVADIIERKYPEQIQSAAPVCIGSLKLAGQDQRVMGINPKDWAIITGNAKVEGRLFDPQNKFAHWLKSEILKPAADDDNETLEMLTLGPKLAEKGGLEIVIDSRLAQAGKYEIGQTVEAGNHKWKIVGIVPAGVATRVFMPLRTAQFLFGYGDITKCTMIFVKLKPGVDVGPTSKTVASQLNLDFLPLDSYRAMLFDKFGIMFTYIDAVNIIALVIAFLFVMTTLYMMVLQQTREIAILKSCGASRFYILRQIIAESMTLTTIGIIIGTAMSIGAATAIEKFKPLLTVNFTLQWVITAFAAAYIGAIISALYPAWQASKIDMIEALAYE